MLQACQLEHYALQFAEQGYDDLAFLIAVAHHHDELRALTQAVGFPPAEARRFATGLSDWTSVLPS